MEYNPKGPGVKVTTRDGRVFEGGNCLVTAPLGCLKAGDISFDPPLPEWKQGAIQRLGFGDLNKVILEFDASFWAGRMGSTDWFGVIGPHSTDPATRGRSFMYWNIERYCGAPVLTSLLSGQFAEAAEGMPEEELVGYVLGNLQPVLGLDPAALPRPRSVVVSRWASEPFSRGSYSYIPPKSSGSDYDQLALPVGQGLFFAGEHTIKEHPDNVGGAMLSGLREAIRWLKVQADEDWKGVFLPPGDVPLAERGRAVKRRGPVRYDEDESGRMIRSDQLAGLGSDDEGPSSSSDEEEDEEGRGGRHRGRKGGECAMGHFSGGLERGRPLTGDATLPCIAGKKRRRRGAEDEEEEEGPDGGGLDAPGADDRKRRKRREGDRGEKDFREQRAVIRVTLSREVIEALVVAVNECVSSGSTGPLVQLMQSEEHRDNDEFRSVLVQQLANLDARASAAAMPVLAADPDFVSTWAAWLDDLLGLVGGGLLPDIDNSLAALAAMKLAPDQLRQSPLYAAVRKAAVGSRSGEVRARCQAWLREHYRPLFDAIFRQRGPQQGQQAKPEGPSALELARQREAEMRAQMEGELKRIEEEARLLEEQARRQRQELALTADVGGGTPGGEAAGGLLSFRDFLSTSKGRKDAAATKPLGGARPKERKPSPAALAAARAAKLVARQDKGGASVAPGGGAGNSNVAVTPPATDGSIPGELKDILTRYTAEKIHPHYKEGRLDKAAYKRIMHKVVSSVAAKEAPGFVPGTSSRDFLTDKRRDKIKGLIDRLLKESGA